MKTRLEQVLEKCLNGREIAVWGNPTRRLLRALADYKFHIAENVDVATHYVVAVTDDDLDDFFEDKQSENFDYFRDALSFEDEGGEQPIEIVPRASINIVQINALFIWLDVLPRLWRF